MLQEQTPPRQRRRRPVPIRPTLVIGLGDFGREVGKQLAARLMLTEESLRGEGLVGPLLAQKLADGTEMPGFVRIMGIDWETWFSSNYDLGLLLEDITISDASLAESGTPPRQREEERPEDDWIEARLALGHPRALEVFFEAASLTLRMHDTPMRKGPFDIQRSKQAFDMRVIVVCAAREAATAQLTPDIIGLLGKIYTMEAEITKGIQIFCYVGGTSRDEHLLASGDPQEYDDLLATELLRILPFGRRDGHKSLPPSPDETFLDRLDEMWKKERPQTIENCYLIDSQLANRVAAVQQRLDEPDETVVATALALNMLITSNADFTVRQSRVRSWDLAIPLNEPGLFSTIGVASYSLDHPKLRRLVYNYVVGKFLERVQPRFMGDLPRQMVRRGASDEQLEDEALDTQIKLETDQLRNEYKKRLHAITRTVPRPQQLTHTLDYKNAARRLARLRTGDVAIVSPVLNQILMELDMDMGENELEQSMLNSQNSYKERLTEVFRDLYERLPERDQAPLVYTYRFSKGSYDVLREEARKVQAPPTNVDLASERRRFAETESDRFTRKRSEHAKHIRREIENRPGIAGLAIRALLLAPLLIYAWNAVTTTLGNMFAPLLAIFKGLPALIILPALPFWLSSAIVAGITWVGLFLLYRWHHARRIGKQLKALAKLHKSATIKADEEARCLAVAHHLEEREQEQDIVVPLCEPGGMIATLREALLAEQFMARDTILERIFFDSQLQANLRNISNRLASNDSLWKRRGNLIQNMLSNRWQSRQALDIWLREQAGEAHKDDAPLIVDLVESFLKLQTAQRLQEIWNDLSNAAALFLRYNVSVQDESSTNIEMFGVNDLETLYELEDIALRSGVEILNSADRLRWIFMHVQSGLQLKSIKFAVEAHIP